MTEASLTLHQLVNPTNTATSDSWTPSTWAVKIIQIISLLVRISPHDYQILELSFDSRNWQSQICRASAGENNSGPPRNEWSRKAFHQHYSIRQ